MAKKPTKKSNGKKDGRYPKSVAELIKQMLSSKDGITISVTLVESSHDDDLSSPTPNSSTTTAATEPEAMRRLADECELEEEAVALRGKLVMASLADWIAGTVDAVLREHLIQDQAEIVFGDVRAALFTQDGSLRFGSADNEPDGLQDMRNQIGEQHEPRPTEPTGHVDDGAFEAIVNGSYPRTPEPNDTAPIDNQVTVYVVRGEVAAVTKALMCI